MEDFSNKELSNKTKNRELKIGDIIKLNNGLLYEIKKVYDGCICDIQALQSEYGWMPNFYSIYYSII